MSYQQAVSATIRRIAENLDEALDLSELAREACLSALHFHHVFRGMTGETPLEMHRRLRLERAADSLTGGRIPVTRIAFHAGYETHESFTRAFRRAYARSPSEFRALAQHASEGCARAPDSALAARSEVHFGRPVPEIRLSNLGEQTMMTVEIENLEAMRLAVVRHVGPYNMIGRAFDKLGSSAAQAGLFEGPPTMVAIYHDDPGSTPAAQLRSDAGVVVSESATIPEGLGELRVPAGRYARATHVGAFDTLGDTWARLMGEWLPQSGLRVGSGVSLEIYRSDMRTTATADLRTDIYVPLE
jgi:AraC family transcriptional regulator